MYYSNEHIKDLSASASFGKTDRSTVSIIAPILLWKSNEALKIICYSIESEASRDTWSSDVFEVSFCLDKPVRLSLPFFLSALTWTSILNQSMSFLQYILIIVISWSISKTQNSKRLDFQLKKTPKKEDFWKRKYIFTWTHQRENQKHIHISMKSKSRSWTHVVIIYRSRTTHSIDSTSSKSS